VRRPILYVMLASFTVAAVVALVVVHGARRTNDANAVAVAAAHSIVASSGARWSRTESATVERVELGEGELAIKVHRVEQRSEHGSALSLWAFRPMLVVGLSFTAVGSSPFPKSSP